MKEPLGMEREIKLPPQPITTVKLLRPLPWFDGQTITEVKIKEPTGGQYVKLGDPRTLVFNASGSGYWVEQADTIRAYLETCVVHDIGAAIVDKLALEDVMGVKEALFGFFTDAAAKRSGISSIPSSSDST
jgi:hypothetical protein